MATHVAFYPVGVVSRRAPQPFNRYTLSGMPPLHRSLLVSDVEAAGTPILLLHGLIDNRSIFTRLHRSLRRRGFGHVTTVNLQMYANDVETAAARLGRYIETVCEQLGYPSVHVVAHSLGGLVARYYIQKLGGDARIHTLVTLGTPHEGTRLAHMLPTVVPYRLVAQLRPKSPLLVALSEPAPGCRTRFVCFGGQIDTVVRPAESAMLHHPDLPARNIMMPGLGHHALPFDSRVVHEIASTLARLDTIYDLSKDVAAAAGSKLSSPDDATPDPHTVSAASTDPGGADVLAPDDDPAAAGGKPTPDARAIDDGPGTNVAS